MSSPGQNFRFYKFGDFTLDVRRRVLLKNGEQLVIPTKHYDLLLVLVENEGQVLSHDELLDRVWEGTFVEQSNLKKGISALRQVFGETPNSSLFIRTVPRRGYSFVAPIEKVSDEPEAFFLSSSQIIIEEEIIEDDSPTVETKKLLPALPSSFFANYKTIIFISTLLLICGLIYFGYRSFFRRPGINFSVENVRAVRLTNEGNLGNSTVISADGNYVLYFVFDGANSSLKVRQVATGSVTTLLPPAPVSYWAIRFSPDGNYVYYILNHKTEPEKSGVYRIPSLGGKPQKLFDYGIGGLTFSPDGNRFAFVRRNEERKTAVISANLDGTDAKQLFTIPEDHFLMFLNWSPDGNKFLTTFRETFNSKSFVSEISVNGSEETFTEAVVYPKQDNPILSAVWLPDKSSMILNIREENADLAQIWQYFPSTGEKRRVTNDNSLYRFAFLTKGGKTLTTTKESFQSGIWIADTQNFDFRAITSQSIQVDSVVWISDTQLSYQSVENFEERIWTINDDGSETQTITDGKDGIGLAQNISKDSNSITYSSSRTGIDQIWKIGLDGKNRTQIAEHPQMRMYSSQILSDGKTLIFLGTVTGKGWALHKQNADGQIIQLTETDNDPSEWGITKDEKLLFFQAIDGKTKKQRTFIKNLETGEIVKTFDFQAEMIKWSADEKGLVYIKNSVESSELVFQPLHSEEPKTLYGLRGERIMSFDFSPDGKKIAIVRGRYVSDGFMIKTEN